MAIDDPRRDVHSLAVDDRRSAGSLQAETDRGNFSGGHEQVGVLERALWTRGPDRRALNQQALWLLGRGDAAERAGRIGLREIERLIERRRFLVRFFYRRECGRALRAPAKIRRGGRVARAGNCFAAELAGQAERALA